MSFRDESSGGDIVHIFNFLNPAVNPVIVQQENSYGQIVSNREVSTEY